MNRQERIQLLAERTTVERLLAEVPPEDVIDRWSLESRIWSIDAELAAAGPPGREPATARLTFAGPPVVDRHGISAEFAAKAMTRFTDAVAKVAAGLRGPLAAMGPVPNRDEAQLLITGKAVGSFGFELEERLGGPTLLEDETDVSQAIGLTSKLLEGTLGTDDDLADSVLAVEPRAVVAVREFLNVLLANGATCPLRFKDKEFRFRDVQQVKLGARRLEQDNLQREDARLVGEFVGVLPKGRAFEFKLAESAEIVRGRVGSTITDPDIINNHLHQKTTIDVLSTRVGAGKPRYVLLELPAWDGGSPPTDPGA